MNHPSAPNKTSQMFVKYKKGVLINGRWSSSTLPLPRTGKPIAIKYIEGFHTQITHITSADEIELGRPFKILND